MDKVKKNKEKKHYWLQFVISALGTAIGVALTFGLNGLLENRKQAQAQRLTNLGLPSDLLTRDIHDCIDALGEITGHISSQDVLNNIFGKFCIGK